MNLQTRVDQYIAHPSAENARKVAAHAARNPMAECLLSSDHAALVRECENIARRCPLCGEDRATGPQPHRC